MCHAFVIDDEPEIRMALQQSFDLEGIQAQFFDSAEAAIHGLKQTTPHVIISDIRLPGVSGLDLLQRVLHQHPAMPIILITGHGDISMAVEAMHLGAYDFIEKPFLFKC